jgi:uncharacterized NAD(P)/FAD-binding protein YdhS
MVTTLVRKRNRPERAQTAGPQHLVICGGGASAVLLARALQRAGERPLDVTVVEARQVAGAGLAYSTTSASHLLNVPAGRMSADADDANGFVTWLATNMPGENHGANSFVARGLYGAYLKNLLSAAAVNKYAPVQVRVVHAGVEAVRRETRHWTVALGDGRRLDADLVVIATGNAPPKPRYSADDAANERVLNDPWDAAAKSEIARDADVALIGSGLTAVDIAVELLDRGHRGRIRMVSRHGLLPRKHAPALISAGWLFPPYPESIAELMRLTRDEARRTPGQDSWRTAIDALRPKLPEIWRALSGDDKARFLRHVRPFWEVHRHRMAPDVAHRIEGAIADGRIVVEQGRLFAIERARAGGGLALRVKARGHEVSIPADIAINCTGPECDPTATRNPLIVDLLQAGLAAPDPLHLGLNTDGDNRVIAADGRVHESLYAIGPVARGRLWEVTAVPEIRHQAACLSRIISPSAIEQAHAYAI